MKEHRRNRAHGRKPGDDGGGPCIVSEADAQLLPTRTRAAAGARA
jgi:hypothetical protein